jgi:hypothetical protein
MANKTYDTLGLIVASQAVSTTASCTGANIVGLNIGVNSFVAVFNHTVTTGTVDGSNYYTLQLEASDLVGGTYFPIGNAVKLPATAGQFQIGFTSEQLADAVTAAGGADFFRVTCTKVGTTATAVTYTAFLSKN